jgi:hypothetical protein
MTEPVAEVVARLRAHAQYLRENLPTTSEQHLPEKKARISNLEGAADLIERLSRERDTGVPEIKTALGIAHAALTAHTDWHLKQIEPQTIDGMEIVPADAYCDSTLYELTQDALHHVERMEAKLSAAPQPPTVSPDIVALTRERDQAREALAKELDAAKADLNSSFFCVFLDGRNEHGSHVVEMPGSNITPDDAKDLVAVLNDQDLGFAEQIIKDAESLGHEVGHCVVTIWDLTHDPEWGVECEYRRISPVLTNLMVGTPDEQRARSVLQSEKEEKA